MIEKELRQDIDIEQIISHKQPFALYRIPGQSTYTFLRQTADQSVVTFTDIEQLNDEMGFVIAPFKVSTECPIVFIRPDEVSTFDLPDLRDEEMNLSSAKLEQTDSEDAFEEYQQRFELFIEALQTKRFEKLVLSRQQQQSRTAGFRPLDTFFEACRLYVHSYVYLCYTPLTGFWLGSTPEIILSGQQGRFQTVALAGTQSLNDGQLPEQWDHKNRKEQEYVAAYIRRQLETLHITPKENGPFSVYAGALSHLKTTFEFDLPQCQRLGDLLQLLHPTPAVCGLPKQEAYQFILDHEGHDRRYYSGFIGWINPKGQTDLYVNLRCMHIEAERLTLYAGGGLLASSDLNDEWMETEKKLQTMKRLLKL